MTSNFSGKTHSHLKSFMYCKLAFCASLLTLTCGLGAPANASEEWQHATVPITGIVNYSREKCVQFAVGEKVEYRFSSKHPVNFNIHYHPREETLYKIKKENIENFSGEFMSDSSEHYCFTWSNHAARGENWPISFEHRVLK